MSAVWLDGKILPESRALVPATDPSGRGLFETLRAYSGVPFRLKDHMARMRASARRFKIPFRAPDLEPAIAALCRKNRAPEAAVRITLSSQGRMLVTVRPYTPPPRATRLRIARWVRDPRSPLAGHKTLSYWEHVLAHEEALRAGCADTIYLGPRGEILEGAITNIFLVLRGTLVTPPLGAGILPGVTRRVVMELAPVAERTVYRADLRQASEVFLTNALIEILPIGRPGPVTRTMMEGYRALVAKTHTSP